MVDIIPVRVGADNFCYIVQSDGECAVVDPGADATLSMRIVEDMGFILKYVIATHHHNDHTSSVGELVEMTKAKLVASPFCSSRIGGADIIVADGDILSVGNLTMKVISTPGHTPGSICLDVDGRSLLTGDTLFINDCGRCDLPGGSLEDMFDSLQKLKQLPGEWIVFPGHDYGPHPTDLLSNQIAKNPCLRARNLKEFSGI